MRRTIVVAVVFFTLGYLANGFLASRGVSLSLNPLPDTLSRTDTAPNSRNLTVAYDGKRFNPPVSTIDRGRYLTVINESQSLMWLVSEDARFTTPRGYGYKEQVKVRVNTPGTIIVANKLDPGATATITVK